MKGRYSRPSWEQGSVNILNRMIKRIEHERSKSSVTNTVTNDKGILFVGHEAQGNSTEQIDRSSSSRLTDW